MIIVILIVFGLCLGSFVNALVWRLREQQSDRKQTAKPKSAKSAAAKSKLKQAAHLKVATKDLSIIKGRSMCPHCHHKLSGRDLIPVVSWLSLNGKCRYCHKPISWQYPVVELLTAALFVFSYIYWPYNLHGAQIVIFALWSMLLVGFMALIVYDLRWYLLPNRIIYPLSVVAGLLAIVQIAIAPKPALALLHTILGVIVGGGIFYGLFQVSKGKWIGGGDVKLGWVLGLVLGSPSRSFLFIFLAALGGSLFAVPLMLSGKLKPKTVIPFGPFLIAGAIVTMLFGGDILHWYQYTLIGGSY